MYFELEFAKNLNMLNVVGADHKQKLFRFFVFLPFLSSVLLCVRLTLTIIKLMADFINCLWCFSFLFYFAKCFFFFTSVGHLERYSRIITFKFIDFCFRLLCDSNFGVVHHHSFNKLNQKKNFVIRSPRFVLITFISAAAVTAIHSLCYRSWQWNSHIHKHQQHKNAQKNRFKCDNKISTSISSK